MRERVDIAGVHVGRREASRESRNQLMSATERRDRSSRSTCWRIRKYLPSSWPAALDRRARNTGGQSSTPIPQCPMARASVSADGRTRWPVKTRASAAGLARRVANRTRHGNKLQPTVPMIFISY
jgi:hypothetical protein